jgi:hypothetical protein
VYGLVTSVTARLARYTLTAAAATAGLVLLNRSRASSTATTTQEPAPPRGTTAEPPAPPPALSQAAGEPAQAPAPPSTAPRSVAAFFFANFTGLASIAGLIVYAIVRVAYDAFYSRLGISPETVGLTETMILGRAALYLFLFFATTAAFGGAWVLLTSWQANAYCDAARCATGSTLRRILRAAPLFSALAAATLAALLAVFLPLALAAGTFRDSLFSRTLAWFCHPFCELKPLAPHQTQLRDSPTVERFVEVVPGWTLALIPLGFVIALGLAVTLHALIVRRGIDRMGPALPLASFGLLGLVSLATGLAAPHFIKVLEEVASLASAPDNSLSLLEANPAVVKWAVFAVLLLTLVTCCVPAVGALAARDREFDPGETESDRLAERERASAWANRILHVRWMVLSFLIALPIVLGFFAPNVTHFLQSASISTPLAAIALWVVLMAAAYVTLEAVASRRLDSDEAELRALRYVAPLVAVLASLAIIVASSRGENLADQAADGSRVYARGFNVLSVRANVVCLQPVSPDTKGPQARPYQHLGESGGSLVLYDYVADRRNDVPRAFPLRVPASSFVVRLAHHDPSEPRLDLRPWNCQFG